MSFSHRIRMRLIRRVALGLAVAAVAAPSAMAIDPALLPEQGAGARAGSAYGLPLMEAGPSVHQFQGALGVGSYGGLPLMEVGPSVYQFSSPGIVPALPAYSVDGPRTGPATSLPTFSVDAPRSGPANVTETPLVGGRFGRPDLAPNTGGSSTEVAWPEVGAGLGIGIAAALGLAALGFGMMRRRGTLQGA